MFLTLKIRLRLFIVFVLLSIGIVSCVFVPRVVASTLQHHNGKIVVIDAGHGGRDGGVVGVTTKVTEAEINLAITKSLQHILSNKGYTVVLTRKNSNGLYGNATSNFKSKDMQERKRIIEESNPDLMISIHQNSYPRANQYGAQVFYSIGADQNSKKNAQLLQTQLNASLPNSKRVPAKGDYFVLNATKYPSLLVECGFLSTPNEEKLLVTAQYQEKVAYGIFSGIDRILSKSI